ncbi:SDR family NAD(P)-dependent oxidoreductase [Conexibacter woesei]|uniref:Short-chain dehydrogenase/reductase SDR n=1 Tax=Conexibacter woesei (strain DSM 14684 / CCUG 47730 / CIP 108061 / JCM 11494 / NBRC 100937 / ID131577) TaxID=469383 RepID=D3F708_CONWI|nr:SDR family oxidoreductase [Conexibacter woesei]ADB52806.1 short-chain dehydrogenase/reductase SDR [Conexibacter woesei DSM 14684]
MSTEGSQAGVRAGRLDGRVVIVTGAAGGFGVPLCDMLEREGATVVGVDREGDGVLHADVGSEAGNRSMVETALERHGRLDGLVLNAGVQYLAPIDEHDEAQWDRLHDVMVKGPFLAIRAAWPALTRAPGGRVVVTASGSSFLGEAYKAAYVAAKHGVLGLMKVAALEGAPLGLTANAVAPAWMRTPMVERQLEDQMRLHGKTREEVVMGMVERHPVDRFVEPEEVAHAVAFLLGPEASGINGVCLPVDLGTLVG